MSQTNNPQAEPQGTPDALERVRRIEEILKRTNPATAQDLLVVAGEAEGIAEATGITTIAS